MKKYTILAMMLMLIGLLLYYGYFGAPTEGDADISYGTAVFLAFVAGRRYFDEPVFETQAGKTFWLGLALLFLGFCTQPSGGRELMVLGVIIGYAGCGIYGMEMKEKELRKRARLLGIEELMFPKETK